MPNGIDIILADHERVKELFAQFNDAPDGNLVGLAIAALEAHDQIEHGALYPLAGHVLGDEAMIERFATAHSAVKKQIDLIATLEGPPLVDAFAVLQQLVLDHADDEERTLLPALGERATPQQLEGLGARMLQIIQRVG